MVYKVLVWDLPTRCFHWLLAGAVLALVITGEIGGSTMVWHFRLGTLVLALLIFRVVWGFRGAYWSRFASFVVTPRQLWQMLAGRHTAAGIRAGHHPMGGYAVLLLLLLLGLQAGSGLCSDDGILARGPLAPYLPEHWVAAASFLHTTLIKVLLLGMVALHLCAIAWYRFVRKEDLLGPMLHGHKLLPQPAPASRDTLRTRLYALLTVLLAGLALALLVQGH